MFLQKVVDDHLVFFQREGTGGIDNVSARAERGGGLLQNSFLPLGTVEYILHTPLPDGNVILAEHTFAGARCIHHNHIKGFREDLRDPDRIKTSGGGIAKSKTLHISGQDFTACMDNLVGNQNAVFAKLVTQLTAFAARRGTHVQNPPVGLNFQTFGGSHSAGILHVDHACMVEWMVPDFVIIQIESGFHIRDMLGGERVNFGKILHGDFFGIDTKGAHCILLKGFLVKTIFFLTQQLPHSCCKFNW